MNGESPDAPHEEARVFLSYSRSDRERAQAVADSLRARHFGVFKDTDDILPTEEWKDRLQQLIEEADTIVFLLSPQSARSEVCAWEVEHAASLNKRIAPIVIEDVDGAEIPPLLAKLNFIFCTPRDPFENAMETLSSALSTDIGWIREHTRIGGLALRWDAANRPARLLPRGQEIEDMERWRDARPPDTPEITALHASYIASARHKSAQRLRAWLIGGAVMVAATTALAAFAYLQSIEADRQRVVAEGNAIEAATQRDRAETERAAAEAARNEAVDQRNAALLNQSRFLASLSGELLDEGRAAEALALAYEALPQDAETPERPLSRSALRALRHGMLELREVARISGQERIGSALYSPNGNGLATADPKGGIIIRNARNGDALMTIDAHAPGFVSMAFGANSGFLLSGGGDLTPRLWSLADGMKMTDVYGLGSFTTAVAVANDTNRIAAADFEGRLKMWNLRTGDPVGDLGIFNGGVIRLAFSDDSSVLVAMEYDELRIWSAQDGREIARFSDPTDRVTAFALRPYGSEFALGRENGDIELRSTKDGSLLADVTGQHGNAITRLVYAPDGWTIASIDLIASYAVLTRAEVGAPLLALLGHEERLTDIDFSHDSAFVITGGTEAAARIWNAERGHQIALLGGHREGVAQVGFNPKRDMAFTLSGAGIVRLWSAPEPLVGGKLEMPPDWNTVATGFAPDGAALIVRRDSATRAATDEADAITFRHDFAAETGAISNDGRYFAVADEAGALGIFSFEEGHKVQRLTLNSPATALRFAEDGQTLLIGQEDGTVLRLKQGADEPELMHSATGSVVEIRPYGQSTGILRRGGFTVLDQDKAVVSHAGEEAGIAFVGGIAPDLSQYAVFGPAGEVSLRSANGDLLRVLPTQFKSFRLIRFSDDGSALLVGGGRSGLAIFDATTGDQIVQLSADGNPVSSATLGDSEVLFGDTAGKAFRLPLYLESWDAIAQAKTIVNNMRPLSEADRCRFFLAPVDAC